MKANRVLIVGSGLGSLATALRLATRGFKVEIVEKHYQAGGRLNQLKKDGFTFDIGPSFFSMPYEFDELIQDCGIRQPFEFVELDPLYTVNFSNSKKKYYIYKDIDKLSAQFFDEEPDFKKHFLKYIQKSAALYNDTVNVVIKQNFNGYFHYIKSLMQVNPLHLPVLFRTFWQQVNGYFISRQAKQIISLIAFFLGRTPFDTNAVYTLLSYIEFIHTGYYNVKGGMYKIVEGLVKELEKLQVTFHYNTEITDFIEKNEKLYALKDSNGREWQADIFVINSDAAYFRGKVFKRKAYSEKILDKKSWTMGYLTLYLGVNRKLSMVEHHNYFIGNNYEQYAKGIMFNPATLEKPYYYVNLVSKHNPECAPEGHDALFIVCPVPYLKYKFNWDDKEIIADSIISDFSERIGINIERHIVSKTIFTPQTWADAFNLYKGSGLGLSHSMFQIGAFRPTNYDEVYPNVFYVGASTIPGAGLPMSIISSKLATKRIVDYTT